MQSAVRSRLVNQVDRFVGQIALIDIFRTHVHRIGNDTLPVGDAMKFLKIFFKSLENTGGILNVWLLDINILKAPHKTLALLKMLLVFLIGRRADKADVP